MNVSADNIAADLAGRLGEVVPVGLSVRSDLSSIQVFSGDQILGTSPSFEIIDDNDGRNLPEKIETATRAALCGIQDLIIENIRAPWPGNGVKLPQPDCRVTGHELLVWFGDEGAPALSIPPISLY